MSATRTRRNKRKTRYADFVLDDDDTDDETSFVQPKRRGGIVDEILEAANASDQHGKAAKTTPTSTSSVVKIKDEIIEDEEEEEKEEEEVEKESAQESALPAGDLPEVTMHPRRVLHEVLDQYGYRLQPRRGEGSSNNKETKNKETRNKGTKNKVMTDMDKEEVVLKAKVINSGQKVFKRSFVPPSIVKSPWNSNSNLIASSRVMSSSSPVDDSVPPTICCGRVYNTRAELAAHDKAIGHGPGRFNCPDAPCNRLKTFFASRIGLRRHRQDIHGQSSTGVTKPYQCQWCEYSSSHLSNFYRHCKQKHLSNKSESQGLQTAEMHLVLKMDPKNFNKKS